MKKSLLVFVISLLIKNIGFSYQNKYDLQYLFIESYYQENFGNISQAVYILNQILSKDTSCGICYYQLSNIYANYDDNKNALRFAYKALLIDSTNLWYLKNYINLLLKENRNKNIIYPLLYKLYNHKNSGLLDKLFVINTYIENNDSIYVIPRLINELENIYGLNNEIYFQKYLYHKYITQKEANKILIEGIKIFPDDEKFIDEYVNYLIHKKKYNEALRFINNYHLNNDISYNLYSKKLIILNLKSKELLKNELKNLFVCDEISVEEKKKIIIEFLNNTDYKVFKDFINFKINSLEKIENEDLFNYLSDLALKYNDVTNYLNITELFKNLFPENNIAWAKYIYGLFLNYKYDDIYNLLIEKEEYFKAPLISYIAGFVLNLKDQGKKAVPYLIRSLNVNENYGYKTFAVELLAQYYHKNNIIDSVFYYYEKSIQENYANDVIYNNYAYYLAENDKDLLKAAGLSLKSLAENKKNASFLDTYAWIAFKLKNYETAYKYIKLAYKYSSEKNNEIIEHYAKILYCYKNDKKKAVKILKKIYSDNDTIELKLIQTKCN